MKINVSRLFGGKVNTLTVCRFFWVLIRTALGYIRRRGRLRSKTSCSYRLRPHWNRQWTGLRLEETRVEKTYIGQRAHSAIQYQKPSCNTYYSCPFSQSGNLKPSSFRKPSGGGHETCFVISSVWRSFLSKRLIFFNKRLIKHTCVWTQESTTTHRYGVPDQLA